MNANADDRSGDLLARWRTGDQQAAQELFRRYADRLITLARSRLSAKLSNRIDPEDVVQSAYRSFFADSRAGRYTAERGGELWQLLVTITLHKLKHQVERHTAQKRDVKREQPWGSDEALLGMQADVLAREPSPLEALTLADEVQALMRGLTPPQRRMLELRLQGHSLDEIAQSIPCSQRTVIRVLERVRQQLEEGYSRNA